MLQALDKLLFSRISLTLALGFGILYLTVAVLFRYGDNDEISIIDPLDDIVWITHYFMQTYVDSFDSFYPWPGNGATNLEIDTYSRFVLIQGYLIWLSVGYVLGFLLNSIRLIQNRFKEKTQ